MMEMELLDKRVGRLLEEIKRYAALSETEVEGVEISRRASNEWKPFANGGTFGGESHWWDFRFTAHVPKDYSGKQLFLTVRTGCEGLWDATNPQFLTIIDGVKRQAIDTNHTTVLLGEGLKGDETFDIYLEGYSKTTADYPAHLLLKVVEIDPAVTSLYFDAKVPLEAAELLPRDTRPRLTLLEALSDAMNLLDLRAPHSPEFDAGVKAAAACLKEKLYGDLCGKEPEIIANCVGHTHIDVAWLWDLYQTRHKAVRSFATVCELMRRYPEYKFMSSQPVLYQFVKEDAPDLYEEIKRRVAEGRWECEGGMWVEADCNIAGGEALVRQFLYGKEFFRKEFGKDNKILWLPDVFGYSAALPQICKKCGIDYFMTTKLSWSEYNKTPYDTFMWKGLDGSEVLTHFIPTRDLDGNGTYEVHESLAYFTTYNGNINPRQMAGGWNRFQQKGLDNQFLVSYGYGDGGGGPTDTMLEFGRRMEKQIPGMPKVRQEHALPFFEALEERVKDDPRLPKWSGELYLEYHRGTYTSMAKNKRNNRKIEIAMRECELWSELAAKHCGYAYPAAELHEIWRTILTLQFHDILPGSSIKKVYDDSDEMYADSFAKLDTLTTAAKDAITANCSGDVVIFNSLSHARNDVVWFDAPESVKAISDAQGNRYAVQHVEGKACAYVEGIPAMGAKSFAFAEGEVACDCGLSVSKEGFENKFFKGVFAKDMRISSLIEKASGREVAREPLNNIVCYENKPHNYDAWDMNIYYSQRHWDVNGITSVELVTSGPVLGIVRVKYAYVKSAISQDIIVYAKLPRIDFKTTVDWKEQQYLLKAHFPVDVFYNYACYDVQFGNVQRATHKNTSWDVARFECCAHKWADVSEAGFGVALLNDCKYGHSIDEHSIALTLLKSATYPNEEADQCVHEFTYSLMPHDGGWREAGVVDQAYSLNIPLTAHHAGKGNADALPAFASVDAPNVIIEAVKEQLDGTSAVARVYECYGKRTHATLALATKFAKVSVTNMLEQKERELSIEDGKVCVELKPYEILTLMFE